MTVSFLRTAFLLLLGGAGPLAQGSGLPPIQVPDGNPITAEKADLGKALFWDEQLSSTRTVSCGTCHIPTRGGSDPRSDGGPASLHPGQDGFFGSRDDGIGSPGIVRSLADGNYRRDPVFGLRPQVTRRKSPSMINAAYAPELFWDGRSIDILRDPISGEVVLSQHAALENQALSPPLSEAEMGHEGRSWNDVAQQVSEVRPLALAEPNHSLESWIASRSYAELFEEAFGTPEVTPVRIAMAIATYERTLISDQTPFDLGTLTETELRGWMVFTGNGNCNACHLGALFTDDQFHNIGVRPPQEDLGRFEVTGLPRDRARFKTPRLRNVALRAPYFHNGSAQTLKDVVEFYNRGGDFEDNRDPLIRPLNLTVDEREALVAFLQNGLTDPRVKLGMPPFDRPTLFTESSRKPAPLGVASPGTNGFAPRSISLEPAALGNPDFTLALDEGRAGASAYLFLDTESTSGTTIQGATIYLGLSPSFFTLTSATLQGAGPGDGWTSYTAAIPNEPGLAGTRVYAQWVVLDPHPGGRLAASAAVELPIF